MPSTVRRLVPVVLLVIAAVAVARDEAPPAAEPEIRDPFFAFIVGLVEGDSLGVWTRAEIETWIASTGRPSKLPIDRLISVSRLPTERPVLKRQYVARRRLRLVLDDDLELQLPYSILGYHPGTLHVSNVIATLEWELGSARLRHRDDDDDDSLTLDCRDVRALRLDEGWVVLDVDGWLDRLLGRKLDDTWMEAFVLGRVTGGPDPDEDGLQGLALGRARNGRPLAGSFDFRRDEVLPNGRPVARALSGFARPVAAPYEESPDSRAWVWPRGR